ncbi:TlpA disulfide reductase family protein [Pedobacter sp. FW305-3-2-15-E-R2A2]|uniref:TlpA family protein disulfide reductase n=1 Tax=Pedobacter sp. FW305-3-2-15-E-R2A2 TaxID=3140251 RepID=UPI00313FE11A
MELMLNMMLAKPLSTENENLLDASAQNTAITFAEVGNLAKAQYWANQIKEKEWKNSTCLAIVRTLIEKGRLADVEGIIKPIINAPELKGGGALFSAAEKQQFAYQYGVVLYKQRKYKEALVYLTPVTEKQKREGSSIYVLALIHSGDTILAFDELNKLLRKPGYHDEEFKSAAKELFIKKYGNEERFRVLMDSVVMDQDRRMRERVVKMKVNEPAPDFEIKDVNGKSVSLKSLRGKTVFLDFWATWCIPCVGSFPGMQKAVDYYKNDSSVVFMFIHTAEKNLNAVEDAKKIIASKKYSFDVFMDLKDKESGRNPVASIFKVSSLPTKLVIDKEGIIRFKNIGYIGLDEAIPEIKTMIEMSSN